jgi:alanine-glyoxylate transaminase/serine-glyoxylate transaminase/serine-pyruvate transaminase
MDRIQEMLRHIFRTANAATLPLSGTGNLGMEAAFSNLIEPGDTAVVGVNGVFGGRMTEMIERLGGRVVKVEAPWGEIVPMEETIRRVRPKVVGVVHAETSTGVWQPVESIAQAAHEVGALVVMDCVTSLGGCPVEVDRWGIDVAHSGSQKCLGCAPGLAPITFSPRAIEAVKARKTKVQNYYVDILALSQHWCNGGTNRTYHHTLPTTLIYGFYEALRIVLEEGLEARFERHRKNHEALVQGIKELGLELATAHPLWMLNAIRVPHGVDEAAVRAGLLARHGIEIGAAFGPLKGKIWRVGLMGESSRLSYVELFLSGLKHALR